MRLIKTALIFLVLTSVYPGCTHKKVVPPVSLPPISSLDLGTDWGVVDTNYLRMRERPNQTSNLLRGLTRGMVVEIISKAPETDLVENETSYWYNINIDGFRGWVFGAYLKIFDSRSAADTYAGGLQ